MILLDANLLIYASTPSMPEYESALSWLDSRLNGAEKVGMPWLSLLGFLRVTSNRRLFESASLEASWEQVQRWLGVRTVWSPQPTHAHADVLGRLLVGANHKLVSDAHLAALAIEHGLTLCSTDGDFARFKGLRWENPLKVGAK